MHILTLINKIHKDTLAIKEVEEEVNRIANGDISEIYTLIKIIIDSSNTNTNINICNNTNINSNTNISNNNISTVIFYLFKIIEIKIRNIKNTNICNDTNNTNTNVYTNNNNVYTDIISLVESYISHGMTNDISIIKPCVLDTYVLLALYCWPTYMPNFISYINNTNNTIYNDNTNTNNSLYNDTVYNDTNNTVYNDNNSLYNNILIKYDLLYLFLTETNYNMEIDNKRRGEIKKCINTILSDINNNSNILNNSFIHNILNNINNDNIKYSVIDILIKIYKELLKINHTLIDYDVVYGAAPTHPHRVAEFYTECDIAYMDMDKFYKSLDGLYPDIGIIEEYILNTNTTKTVCNNTTKTNNTDNICNTTNTTTNKVILTNNHILNYMYKSISDSDTYNSSIIYFTRIYSKVYDSNNTNTCNISNYIEMILKEIFNNTVYNDTYNTVLYNNTNILYNNTINIYNDSDSLLFNLIITLSKTYPTQLFMYYINNENITDSRYITTSISKYNTYINSNINNTNILYNISFSNIYNDTYRMYIINDNECIHRINNMLDSIINTYNNTNNINNNNINNSNNISNNTNTYNKNVCKLIIYIISKYKHNIDSNILHNVYNKLYILHTNILNNTYTNIIHIYSILVYGYEILSMIDNILDRYIDFTNILNNTNNNTNISNNSNTNTNISNNTNITDIDYMSNLYSIMYYYYIKSNYAYYSKYANIYLEYYINYKSYRPLDRCYTIIYKIYSNISNTNISNTNNINSNIKYSFNDILKYIYDNIHTYDINTILYINNDILYKLISDNTYDNIILLYIDKEYKILLDIYDNISDYKIYYTCINNILQLIENILRNIITDNTNNTLYNNTTNTNILYNNTNNTNNTLYNNTTNTLYNKLIWDYINILINLLYIDYSNITNKILHIFINTIKHISNTDISDNIHNTIRTTIYNLLMCYNMPHLMVAQSNIIYSITLLIIKYTYACDILNEILYGNTNISNSNISNTNTNISNNISNVANHIRNMDKKSACNVIKNVLKDYKGKSINRMYEGNKVKEYKVFDSNINSNINNSNTNIYSSKDFKDTLG
ncbi:inorganic pyrophosphatase exopolyphosphatase [Ecytonucleospora hepatopenaei]|uniref:Inorganic pyrophosphatase exopolyphosphatase n=1 Tax=Ecytonucleospora hepatopenaei TaxID=646526 RepID=A0A1W0E390_9MICR|nr:inorganic pyrophosphatase exopolyphosphatase [Ecytonucleospora hepatopenaei]